MSFFVNRLRTIHVITLCVFNTLTRHIDFILRLECYCTNATVRVNINTGAKKIGKVYVTGVSLAYADIGSAVGFVVAVLLYDLSSK